MRRSTIAQPTTIAYQTRIATTAPIGMMRRYRGRRALPPFEPSLSIHRRLVHVSVTTPPGEGEGAGETTSAGPASTPLNANGCPDGGGGIPPSGERGSAGSISGCGSLASAAPGDVQILGESESAGQARLTRQGNRGLRAHPPRRARVLPCRSSLPHRRSTP